MQNRKGWSVMTPKERVFARLQGQPVDKTPNFSIVMLFAAKYAGIPYGQFATDYRSLVKAQTETAVAFGLDILSTMSDPFRETADFGARITFPHDDLPRCESLLLGEASDWRKLKPLDPLSSVRMLDRIRAVDLFRKNVGDAYPVLGWVEGPWAEFNDLASVNEGMMMLYDDPDEVNEALNFIAEQEIRCALAQVDAGADIIGIGDAVASLVNEQTYREVFMPAEMKVIHAVHQRGAKVKLHICGNINHLIADMVDTGADIVDIDYMVDYDKAIALAENKCSVCGHINPAQTLLNGSVEDVKAATRFCVEHGNARSIVNSGCEVPPMTDHENLKAIDAVLWELAAKI